MIYVHVERFLISVSDRQFLKEKPPPFLNSKGGGFKALYASDQSIADLLKKKVVANDFIAEISFHQAAISAVAKTICFFGAPCQLFCLFSDCISPQR
jgi:hypothetical protein